MGRTLAEARMTDTVLITRASEVYDDATLTYTPTLTTIYNGPGRLSLNTSVVGALDAQGQLLASQKPRLDLPVATSGSVLVNDTVTVTASVNDSASVGLVLNVEGLF